MSAQTLPRTIIDHNLLSAAGYQPARIVKVELQDPLRELSAFDPKKEQCYLRAVCFVYLHAQPLGAVEFIFDEEEIDAQTCARHIWQKLHVQINNHLQRDGLPPVTYLGAEGLPSASMPPCLREYEQFLTHAPFVSVVIPTHNRPDNLRLCLPTLLNQHYPHYEIIIVDNAPATNDTAELIQKTYGHVPQVRYVREDRAGPSWARNAGIAVASGEIIAFTDDDVEVDPYWLAALVRSFDLAQNVGCVTGQVQPLELETPPQYWFEENAGLFWFREDNDPSKRFTRRVFTQAQRHVHLYRIGLFGCGANMAFRAAVLRHINGFDPALGGTGPSRCGQDVAAFFTTMMEGYTLVYEPKALVYHQHRRTYEALLKQLYNYGVGLTAYLTKHVYEYPQLLIDLVIKVPYDLLISRSAETNKKSKQYPKELKRVALKGMCYGPLAFFISRQQARKAGWKYRSRWAFLSYLILPHRQRKPVA
jgi:glycosyltransferase involved in cell wall biosynthesis